MTNKPHQWEELVRDFFKTDAELATFDEYSGTWTSMTIEKILNFIRTNFISRQELGEIVDGMYKIKTNKYGLLGEEDWYNRCLADLKKKLEI